MTAQDGTRKMSQADIAREYMIENARRRAGMWKCECGSFNEREVDVCGQCGADGTAAKAALGEPPAPRFPSSPETRRAILAAIAAGNQKYARPFDQGGVARASFIGTESWAEYGAVVLQMALLDTMLSIEEKLGELLARDQPTDA